MESLELQSKEQNVVKVYAWILIVISTLVLLRSIIVFRGYASMIELRLMTRNFDPPIGINFTLYFLQRFFELLLGALVFMSSVYVMRFRNSWRKILIAMLIVSVIYMLLSPAVSYFNVDKELFGRAAVSRLVWGYVWSITLSSFYSASILKLMNKEVMPLFK